MKLIIQIPCLNEEQTLPITLKDLPRKLEEFPGLIIEWLVISDGSTDKTVEVAKSSGVDHTLSLSENKGLATAWREGINKCLSLGADIIVNLDADNQYSAKNIPDLISPIIQGKADMVIGCRQFDEIPYFSKTKVLLQKLGSKFVGTLASHSIKDATSGFRAYNRKAAASLNVYSKYTYTLETIIHAVQSKLTIQQVPVQVNNKLRDSKLLKSNFSYIRKSVITVFSIFLVYNPLRTFSLLSLFFFIPGVFLGLRFSYYNFFHNHDGMVQSLILSSILIGAGFQMILMGLLGHLLSINRRLLENIKIRNSMQ